MRILMLALLLVGCTTTTTEVIHCDLRVFAHLDGDLIVVDSLQYYDCDDPSWNRTVPVKP